MPQPGRPPKPTEQKRLIGNPGHRPLPEHAAVAVLPAASAPPEPPRPLGGVGMLLWERAWNRAIVWLSPLSDIELMLMVCEQVDERQMLRSQVLREAITPTELGLDLRRALRALDAQIVSNLSLLGFTPTDRTRLGVAEVRRQSALEDIITRRTARE